jgi:hypothetical protein
VGGGQPRPWRNGGILITFLHKKQPRNEDKRFLKLLDRELAEGFPNPDRTGCPGSEFLHRLAHHQVPISEFDKWTDHLGSCSECFGDFNRLRADSRARWRQRVILWGAAACIVFASSGLLWRQLSRGHKVSTPVAGVAVTNPAVAGEERKPFEVTLNLTRFATRGETDTTDMQIIRLPARLLECRMEFPPGSSDGLYYVRVQRAVQSEVLKIAQGNAIINDGNVRLDIELDLSNMSAGRYLLSYRHAGESWRRVPIVITN